MKVLVAHASRHGSTAGIARRIAETLSDSGVDAVSLPVTEIEQVAGYDAVVLGSAAYMTHWLKEANRFVARHRDELKRLPVWIFSSGPLGDESVDDHGNDLLEVSRPREFEDLEKSLRPREARVFFGAWDEDAEPIGLAERMAKKLPRAAREAMPFGDFRNWPEIEAWARRIAEDLASMPASPGDGRSRKRETG